MGLFGIQDPRQRFGGGQAAVQPRVQIPQQPGREQALQAQPQSTGAKGLFELYMSQLFKQKYAPPPMQGGVQNMGGFMGFAGPKLNPYQPLPQAPAPMWQPGLPYDPGANYAPGGHGM